LGALNQLAKYAKAYRLEENDFITYGMVNVGTYTRFYEMRPGSSNWRNFNSSVQYSQVDALEARADEALIHALLLDLARRTRL
jgi:hypothetical protein